MHRYRHDFDSHADDDAFLDRRTRRRRRSDNTVRRRGRLTEEERRRLELRRRDELDTADPPPEGDRWSTWGDGDQGPKPRPPWLITERAAVDHERGVLKTGKEADVHLVERVLPGSGRPGRSRILSATVSAICRTWPKTWSKCFCAFLTPGLATLTGPPRSPAGSMRISVSLSMARATS